MGRRGGEDEGECDGQGCSTSKIVIGHVGDCVGAVIEKGWAFDVSLASGIRSCDQLGLALNEEE